VPVQNNSTTDGASVGHNIIIAVVVLSGGVPPSIAAEEVYWKESESERERDRQ